VNVVERLLPHLPESIARRLRPLIPQSEIRRGVLTLVGGTTIAQGILILSSPILTRLFSPSDLGTFGVVASLLTVLLTITCLAYDGAIALPDGDAAAANVLGLCLVVNVVMTLICAIVLMLVGPRLLGDLESPGLTPYLVLLAVAQLIGGSAAAFTGWAIRTRSFMGIATARVAQSGSAVGVQIALGLVGFGALGLLFADVVGRLAGTGQLVRAAWRSHAPSFRGASLRGFLVAATRYRRFPIFSSSSSLLNSLSLQAPLLIIVALYGTHEGGQFVLAQRVAAMPVVFVAGAVGQVFFGEAARMSRERPGALRGLFKRAIFLLGRAGIGPALLVAVAAPLLFGPLFGDEWIQAGLFTAVLAPMYFLALVTSPTDGTLAVLERQDLHLLRELLRLGLVGTAVLAAAMLRLPPLGTVIVLSAAGCASYLMYGLISWSAILSQRVVEGPEPQVPA
jgi:O-antigen/teichoic acid export membrane protein